MGGVHGIGGSTRSDALHNTPHDDQRSGDGDGAHDAVSTRDGGGAQIHHGRSGETESRGDAGGNGDGHTDADGRTDAGGRGDLGGDQAGTGGTGTQDAGGHRGGYGNGDTGGTQAGNGRANAGDGGSGGGTSRAESLQSGNDLSRGLGNGTPGNGTPAGGNFGYGNSLGYGNGAGAGAWPGAGSMSGAGGAMNGGLGGFVSRVVGGVEQILSGPQQMPLGGSTLWNDAPGGSSLAAGTLPRFVSDVVNRVFDGGTPNANPSPVRSDHGLDNPAPNAPSANPGEAQNGAQYPLANPSHADAPPLPAGAPRAEIAQTPRAADALPAAAPTAAGASASSPLQQQGVPAALVPIAQTVPAKPEDGPEQTTLANRMAMIGTALLDADEAARLQGSTALASALRAQAALRELANTPATAVPARQDELDAHDPRNPQLAADPRRLGDGLDTAAKLLAQAQARNAADARATDPRLVDTQQQARTNGDAGTQARDAGDKSRSGLVAALGRGGDDAKPGARLGLGGALFAGGAAEYVRQALDWIGQNVGGIGVEPGGDVEGAHALRVVAGLIISAVVVVVVIALIYALRVILFG